MERENSERNLMIEIFQLFDEVFTTPYQGCELPHDFDEEEAA
jgi:hypothetical protein